MNTQPFLADKIKDQNLFPSDAAPANQPEATSPPALDSTFLTSYEATIALSIFSKFITTSLQGQRRKDTFAYYAMRYNISNSGYGSRGNSKFLRTFCTTIFLISAFAALSIVADRSARYFQGGQYGVTQKRAPVELDVTRLVKRDKEVCGDSCLSID
jgi:hypothetical protein